jgi:hypothetical protein
VSIRHNTPARIVPDDFAAGSAALPVGVVKHRSGEPKRAVARIAQQGAMDFNVELVCPSARIQAFEPLQGGVEGIKQVAVNGVQPAVDEAVIGVPGDGVETDPTFAPAGIGGKLIVVPAALYVFLPAGNRGAGTL